MTVKQLKEIIEAQTKMRPEALESEVVIPNNKQSWGPISTTKVRNAGEGIDWNRGQFILWPESKMMEIPQTKKKDENI